MDLSDSFAVCYLFCAPFFQFLMLVLGLVNNKITNTYLFIKENKTTHAYLEYLPGKPSDVRYCGVLEAFN